MKRPVKFHQIGNRVYFDEVLNMHQGESLDFDESIEEDGSVTIHAVWLITKDEEHDATT